VEEQGAATQEISRNVQQAAHGTQQVSRHITDVQRGASETGSASSQVLSAGTVAVRRLPTASSSKSAVPQLGESGLSTSSALAKSPATVRRPGSFLSSCISRYRRSLGISAVGGINQI